MGQACSSQLQLESLPSAWVKVILPGRRRHCPGSGLGAVPALLVTNSMALRKSQDPVGLFLQVKIGDDHTFPTFFPICGRDIKIHTVMGTPVKAVNGGTRTRHCCLH